MMAWFTAQESIPDMTGQMNERIRSEQLGTHTHPAVALPATSSKMACALHIWYIASLLQVDIAVAGESRAKRGRESQVGG